LFHVKQPRDDAARDAPEVAVVDATVVERLFGDRAPLAERYAGQLTTAGLERGLLGPREAPRIWDRHILNSAVLAELVPKSAAVCDVGSGAGLPGIPLAIARPDLKVTLLEPLLRRFTFLEETVTLLGLTNVVVRRGRAEESSGCVACSVVTARAVAPLERLARWSAPLLTEPGELLALKGSTAAEELAASEAGLRSLGAVEWSVTPLGAEILSEPTYVTRVRFTGGRGASTAPPPRSRKKRGES
jgi:16S rRNA (guanine527-N7)-methyltransferase